MLPTSMSLALAKGASAYKAYLESPHGRLRLEVIWHQLSGFIGKASGGLSPFREVARYHHLWGRRA